MGGSNRGTAGERAIHSRVLRQQAIGEHTFYNWRKRLRSSDAVEFALVETKPAIMTSAEAAWTIEVSLADGAPIRIANGADPSALRALLETLRS